MYVKAIQARDGLEEPAERRTAVTIPLRDRKREDEVGVRDGGVIGREDRWIEEKRREKREEVINSVSDKRMENERRREAQLKKNLFYDLN